jgi:hypothetical protein
MAFLIDNFLLQFNLKTEKYSITQAGSNFLNKASEAGLSGNSFAN